MSSFPPSRSFPSNTSPTPCPPISGDDLDDVFSSTRDLWEEMRGESLFITGGTGFFGAWLLETFIHANEHLRLGARAVVLTRDPLAVKTRMPHLTGRADIEFLAGALENLPSPAGRYPFVIHAANDLASLPNGSSFTDALESSKRGLDHLLDFVGQAGTQKLLLTSSGAVYGKQPPELAHLTEDYPATSTLPVTNAALAYAESKRIAEQRCLIHARRSGYAVKIARCFAFVGPHLPLEGEFAAGNFIRDALRREPIQIQGDGTPYRSYLYAADLAIWLWTLLFRGQSERPYNVGSDQALTIADLADRIAESAQTQRGVIIAESPVPGRAASRYVPAIDRAQSELNLTAHISLETALLRTLRWYRPILK